MHYCDARILEVEIRMARAALDWSAEELAAAAHVGRNTIARIEAGISVRKGTAKRVRDALTDAGVRFGNSCSGAITVSLVPADHDRTLGVEAA